MATPIVVDCHSHIFNAEDLPIDGFIKRLSPVPSLLTGVLSLPLDRLTQWAAPGSGEIDDILALLATGGGLEGIPMAPTESAVAGPLLSDAELDARLMGLGSSTADAGLEGAGLETAGMTVEDAIAQALASASPEELEELAAWEAECGDDGVADAGPRVSRGSVTCSARRRGCGGPPSATSTRCNWLPAIATASPASWPSRIRPSNCSFRHWWTSATRPATSRRRRFKNRLRFTRSSRSSLWSEGSPTAGHVRIHPLVGFCPYRESAASELTDWDINAGTPNRYVPYADPPTATPADLYTPGIAYVAERAKPLRIPTGPWASSRLELDGVERSLDIVRHAVELGGFAGVKLYPPAGFLPIGNLARFGERVGGRLDAAMRALYAYCVAEQVPILTHAARSNGFDDGFDDLAAPSGWERVLDDYPQLRICFGHFGHLHGVGEDIRRPSPTSWVMRFMDLVDTHQHVYADVSNSRYVYDTGYRDDFDQLLELLLGSGANVDDVHTKRRRRLMFGSDYWMNTLNPDHAERSSTSSRTIEHAGRGQAQLVVHGRQRIALARPHR